MTDESANIPVDMRSPDVTQIMEQEKNHFDLAAQVSEKLLLNTSGSKKGRASKEGTSSGQESSANLQRVQAELSEYRVRCSKQKERIDHIDRLNREHESLYTEFLVRSIKAERDKRQLERRLARINYIIALMSKVSCSKACFISWLDKDQFTWQRGVKVAVCFIVFILLICLITL